MSRKGKVKKLKRMGERTGVVEDEFSYQTKDDWSEKVGEVVIRTVGSWWFLFLNILAFILWIVFKLHYDWLTFWVSLEAIVLTVLVLIAENVEKDSDRSRAIKDYKIDLSTAQRLKKIEEKITRIEGLLQKK